MIAKGSGTVIATPRSARRRLSFHLWAALHGSIIINNQRGASAGQRRRWKQLHATKRQRSDGGEAAAAAEGVGPVVGPQTSDGGWRASAAFSLSAVMLGRRKLLLVVMLLLTLHLQCVAGQAHAPRGKQV